ncbi:MAG TPA: AAA family ATPase, partial [Nannocystis sp.]
TVSESLRRHTRGEGLDGRQGESLEAIVTEMLRSVFLPEDIVHLVRKVPDEAKTATVRLQWDNGAEFGLSLTTQGSLRVEVRGDFSGLDNAVFVPTRELLSIYPGFTAAWLRRESAFDRTHFDLCVLLGLNPLRGAPDERRALIDPLERATQARVYRQNDRFYLQYDEGSDIEASLAAEGHRKLGMIAYLIHNGSLTANGFLFWDEPEAGINPLLVRATADTIVGLASAGLQTFLSTHDYILASDLSLRAHPDSMRFFALGRGEHGVVAEAGERMTDLEHNAILDAFVHLHARERAAFVGAGSIEP